MKKEKRWRNEMWKTVLFLFFAFTVVSCSDDSDENSIPWYEDATALQLAYDAGVADASVPEASEVVNTLVSITTPEAHPDQEWMQVDNTQMVLVSCMTNKASLKYWQATDTFRITKELWVTVPSEWEKKRLDFVNMDSVSTRMRMVQMLGLPPSSNYEVVIEFYVDAKALFRPSRDPEITDNVAQLEYPANVSAQHRDWFEYQLSMSYQPGNAYPWTQLGYTYDWHQPVTNSNVGLSEFIASNGALSKIKRIIGCKQFIEGIYR